MRRYSSIVSFLAAVLATSSPAAAQTYVAGSLVGDIARFSHVDVPGVDDGSGEAIGFAVRLGTHITPIFGVEIEFARPSVIESSQGTQVLPAIQEALVIRLPDLVFPPISYDLRTETRNTTVAASVWARQELTGRVAMVYSGGIALVRSEQASWLEFVPVTSPFSIPREPTSFAYSSVFEATTYSMQPQVGAEARIGLTERVQLMTGVRLYGLEGGWLLRPSVGLGWTL